LLIRRYVAKAESRDKIRFDLIFGSPVAPPPISKITCSSFAVTGSVEETRIALGDSGEIKKRDEAEREAY
jgi:hypothetical protein